MSTENLNGYTVVGSAISISSAAALAWTTMPTNAINYAYKDFGASFFSGNAYAEGTVKVTAAAATFPAVIAIGFTDTQEVCGSTHNQAYLQFNATAKATGRGTANIGLADW